MPNGSGLDDGMNFDTEYQQVRQVAGDIVTTTKKTRASLDNDVIRFKDMTVLHLINHPEDLKAIQSTVSAASNMLRGCGQFLVDDVNASRVALRKSLMEYGKMIRRRLAEDNVQPESVSGSSRDCMMQIDKQIF